MAALPAQESASRMVRDMEFMLQVVEEHYMGQAAMRRLSAQLNTASKMHQPRERHDTSSELYWHRQLQSNKSELDF